ncbi:membrane protein insertase, YidC/Oxa1 family, C-terminal domain-containing protein [Ruminococcaceae bacterium YRB3002]|nr:membrane protein insertase, YidC/Oxa1 family, C-terminal domain-containing protein [Ruminococcaceae bacterium YRB3002]
MPVLSAIYNLIISPLELLFEIIFEVANKIIGNPGISIIFLSLAVNFLVLPLYKRADELQAEERDMQAKMAPWIKHIKKTFKGDERFMMIQEYYRINRYKPIYALKSSVSLLLQIPFFIAAYNLLSGMKSLQGMSFGIIEDMGREDAMFMIGSFPVNILPIVMTAINIVSGIIYTKSQPLKARIQVFGLAAVFLVLLYHSPAGLVFYWLLNNTFSLVKNIFYKIRNPRKALIIILAFAGLIIIPNVLVRPDLDIRQKILLVSGALLLTSPFILSLIKPKIENSIKADKDDSIIFFLGASVMALITGLLIPSAVIDNSAVEFIDILGLTNPASYIANSLLLSFGTWVLWGGIFFFMSGRIQAVFARVVWIICAVSLVDYLLFGTDLGIMSSALQYEKTPAFGLTEYIVNTLTVIAISVVFGLLFSKFRKIAKMILIIGMVTILAVGTMNTVLICQTYSWYQTHVATNTDVADIPLSRNGKNVIVIMLDRSLGSQVPYIMEEKPELKDKFDGFTYYPNTISYGSWTLSGAPALYGGYDYTPQKLNERSNEKLKDKHNESLRVMPVLFGQNGYKVTICDPSYAGYQMVPDLTIYDDHPEFNCYITKGRFNCFEDSEDQESLNKMINSMNALRNRNFFCFSLMKISPLILQMTFYDNGAYNQSALSEDSSDVLYKTSLSQYVNGLSMSMGYYHEFLNAYAVLMNLPKITTVDDSSDNTFLLLENDTSHSPCLLKEPDYVPEAVIDNTAYDSDMLSRYTIDGRTMKMENIKQVTHYHSNMASFLKLGEWFDYLKQMGVYDNTRIIIVADHGRDLGQFDVLCHDKDMEYFTPLLMVKDFDSKGFTISDTFMTNADTPTLATSGLIKDPVNPFTGNPISSDFKKGPQVVFYSDFIDSSLLTGNTFPSGSWYQYEGDDPLDINNWNYLYDR